jgi:scyllo-inositol 2-dehydrogenase (NADP+)
VLADGALGQVHRFESRFERWRPQPKAGWRESGDAAAGGGILLDLGTHLIDQAIDLFGPVVSVYGEVAARREGAAVDDDAFVALTHAGGVTSHLWASVVTAQRGPRLRVLGDRAGFLAPDLDPQEDALRRGERPDDATWGRVPERSWPLLGADDDLRRVPALPGAWPRFYAGWRDAVLGQGAVPVDPGDAVQTLRVIEAAVESARSGRVVPLPAS